MGGGTIYKQGTKTSGHRIADWNFGVHFSNAYLQATIVKGSSNAYSKKVYSKSEFSGYDFVIITSIGTLKPNPKDPTQTARWIVGKDTIRLILTGTDSDGEKFRCDESLQLSKKEWDEIHDNLAKYGSGLPKLDSGVLTNEAPPAHTRPRSINVTEMA